jgi:hypothetical protein
METAHESHVRISIHCPQCGGIIEFLEEAHVIRCEFCGSSLRVAGREGVLRYVASAQIQTPQEALARALHALDTGRIVPRISEDFLFYAPFWRMRGSVYRWVFGLKPMKVENKAWAQPPMERFKVLLTRVLDHTLPGFTGPDLGLSTLGLRAQSFHLRPFEREDLEKRESFLPLEVSLEQIQAEAEHSANLFFEAEEMITEVILHRLVGRSFSVIYYPLWYLVFQIGSESRSLLVDAVGGKIVRSMPSQSPILDKLRGTGSRKSFEFSEIRFLPFRCPNCGWSFPFRPLSGLHFCASCRRLFRDRDGEWAEIGYAVVTPPGNLSPQKFDELLWVPFWRCRTVLESKGERVDTMASLYQLAPPLKRTDQASEARRPIYFYVPAARFRSPQIFQTLASRLTYIQPEISPASFPEGSHPVTAGGSLPADEAQEMGPVILGALIPQASRKARAWLQGCRIELEDPQILYFPFARADILWKELSTGVAFQRNAFQEEFPKV